MSANIKKCIISNLFTKKICSQCCKGFNTQHLVKEKIGGIKWGGQKTKTD